MRKICIDGALIHSREELFDSIRSEMPDLGLIGNNLDALYDVLSESSEPLEVELRQFGELKEHLGEDYVNRLMQMLNDL